MGANTNSGLLAANGEFIVQLQDDWLCLGPENWIHLTLELLNSRKDIGMVRLRTPCLYQGDEVSLSSGRSAQFYHGGSHRRYREYAYTDNPHIKRRQFHRDIGLYREDVPMPATELDFCARVDAQAIWSVGWINGLSAFEHIGELESFNPGHLREKRIHFFAGMLPGGEFLLKVARLVKRIISNSLRYRAPS